MCREKVIIPYDKPYIVMQGEGLMESVISWGDRASTYGTANSATFTVNAPNFVAKGIGFMVYAKPWANFYFYFYDQKIKT